jgi:hypothetical protein
MSHIDVSSRSIGILNLKSVVHPFGKSKDAIPNEATERTIFFELLCDDCIPQECFTDTTPDTKKKIRFIC